MDSKQQLRLLELPSDFPVLLNHITRLWITESYGNTPDDIDKLVFRIGETVGMLDDSRLRMKLHTAIAVWFDKTHELMELVAEAIEESKA